MDLHEEASKRLRTIDARYTPKRRQIVGIFERADRPLSMPELIEAGSAAVERLVPGIRPCAFGHMGDGNVHFNFSQPVGADPKAFIAGEEPVHEVIYEEVLRLGGSVSAEHGIGQLKKELLQRVKDPVALAMMRSIKQALDPNGIMNPGKLLD